MNKYDKTMLKTAELWAKESYCKRKQVGAVIAKDNRIVSIGYNGTVTGLENECEEQILKLDCCGKSVNIAKYKSKLESLKDDDKIKFTCNCGKQHVFTKDYLLGIEKTTSDFTLHAEQNALIFCSKELISTNGATIYITHSPCKNCAKLIAQSGIVRVVYKERYKDNSGIDLLKKVGIVVDELKYDD